MTNINAQSVLFSEVFPINENVVPKLYAWHLNISGDEKVSIGWKLAYRLRRELNSLWIWSQGYLISNQSLSSEQMLKALQVLWQADPDTFGIVRSLSPDNRWKPNSQAIADFVVFGLASELERDIQQILRQQGLKIRNANIERDYSLQAWVVNEKPALSVSVFSHLISNYSLQEFATSSKEVENCVGLWVKDKLGNYKGEVVEVIGTLDELRNNLIHRTTRKEMRQLIMTAPNDTWVVKVKKHHNSGYDYIANALQLIVRNQDFKRLGVEGKSALSGLQIPPNERSKMVESVAKLLRNKDWIGKRAFSTTWASQNFFTSKTLKFDPKARFGDGYTCQFDARIIINTLKKHPPYRMSPLIEAAGELRIGVINFIGNHTQIQQYLHDIRDQLEKCNFPVRFVGAERPDPKSSFAIGQALDSLCNQNFHLLVALMPGASSDDETSDGLYERFKSLVVGRDLASQVIFESTLGNKYAIDNIVLGILGKTGNTPYILADELPYTDIVAGIDIARMQAKRKSGSVNMAAVARIYMSDGDFLKYILHDAAIEGEILPAAVIKKLFPPEEFAGKRAIIQRDGPFRGYETQDLLSWGKEIGATFHLVEILKSSVPRVYMAQKGIIQKPQKGTVFKLNNREGIVVTTNTHTNSTPRPLTIRTDGTISVENAAHAILSLTMLHYGSMRPPRLPVTIHYSDRIGYLALQGIKPKTLQGTVPYWL